MTIEPGSYLTKGQLKNETIDIGEDELHAFHRAGVKEKKENQKVTLSTYLGDSYFDQGHYSKDDCDHFDKSDVLGNEG